MQVYTFDRSEFNWAEEYYDLIQKKMGLPEWFGKNAAKQYPTKFKITIK